MARNFYIKKNYWNAYTIHFNEKSKLLYYFGISEFKKISKIKLNEGMGIYVILKEVPFYHKGFYIKRIDEEYNETITKLYVLSTNKKSLTYSYFCDSFCKKEFERVTEIKMELNEIKKFKLVRAK